MTTIHPTQCAFAMNLTYTHDISNRPRRATPSSRFGSRCGAVRYYPARNLIMFQLSSHFVTTPS